MTEIINDDVMQANGDKANKHDALDIQDGQVQGGVTPPLEIRQYTFLQKMVNDTKQSW